MLLKYELLGLAVLSVAWTIFKAVIDWTDRRKEFDILLDECRAEWRRRHQRTEQWAPNEGPLRRSRILDSISFRGEVSSLSKRRADTVRMVYVNVGSLKPKSIPKNNQSVEQIVEQKLPYRAR